MLEGKKILVAPLNWGLGHATRCVPLVNALRQLGAQVMLASDGGAYDLLRAEYPDLPIFELPSYNIRYPFRAMVASMATQMPKILRGCLAEHWWLRRFVRQNAVDCVISDNRFGFFHPRVPSVFVTHQVNIQIPFQALQNAVNRVNHFFISQFDACWIPDFADEPSLAGVLSHGKMPRHVACHYLGNLTRMRPIVADNRYALAIVLSGPEPQRTALEAQLCAALRGYFSPKNRSEHRVVFVRGVTHSADTLSLPPQVEVHNYLTTNDLNQKMAESACIICRSGYSTIMDLVALRQKAILVPTPGQTEQEYLAQRLTEKGLFWSVAQAHFDLETALQKAETYSGFTNFGPQTESLVEIIPKLLKF